LDRVGEQRGEMMRALKTIVDLVRAPVHGPRIVSTPGVLRHFTAGLEEI